MANPSPELSIEVLSAGAGSGKTYTLTGRMVDLLKNGVRPAGILATTFTKKAAAELQERVRVRLLEAGMTEQANELGEALIGTVHSIGTRLLQRFAFEAGVSPLVEIIADGDEQRLFNESLAQVLSEERIEKMNLLADRLGLTKQGYGQTAYDWRRDIRQLTDVARGNNFDEKILKISKKRSWEAFERLLTPVSETNPVVWNNRLISAIDQTVAALENNEADTTKVTRDAVETLLGFQRQLKTRGELYWHEWVKISKTKTGAKSADLMADLQQLALSHDEHPQFREDIRQFMDMVFDIAADALREYERYKTRRGLIDYTDMETRVSQLLRLPEVCETLRQELDLLLVDEFQDTSPIQLDIFLRLSRLAKHSIWVGDPKQSIYGFRGAEPALMQAIIDATGGVKPENILKKSWRSRPDLVRASNAIFTRAFDKMPPEQVVLEPAVSDPDPLPDGVGRALVHWHFRSEMDERKTPGSPWLELCIAEQIKTTLERGVAVFNKKRNQTRPVRPGDIAILCRSNTECVNMANALHQIGLKAAISRNGLLETAEAKLTLACLKFLLTPSDSLSIAEILVLTGGSDLETLVNERLQFLAHEQDAGLRWAQDNDYLKQLFQLRTRTADLSASEILTLVIEELDLRRLVAQMGAEQQRLDNLDRLRRMALDYESACQRLHSAASLGGFLLWVNEVAERDLDAQGSGESEDAVKVLTYHRSKGLEYPVTVCHALNNKLRENIWGLNLVSEIDRPDLEDILGHRWLRFWVNPYADQLSKTRLEERLHDTPEWATARRAALDEEARLLYVGLTRARDYLVFPTAPNGTKWLNRVFNHGDETIPTLDAYSDETPFYHGDLPLLIETEMLFKPTAFGEAPPDLAPVSFHSPRKGRHQLPRPPAVVDVQNELPFGVEPTFSDPRAWGSWLEFSGEYDADLGKAVQAFFIADFGQTNADNRLVVAARQLEIRQQQQALSPQSLVLQSDSFQAFIQQMFQPETAHVKYALSGISRGKTLDLDVDFWLETPSDIVLVSLANFAEGMKKWRNQAQAAAPLLFWARWLAMQIRPGKSVSTWVVFPMEAQAVELMFP